MMKKLKIKQITILIIVLFISLNLNVCNGYDIDEIFTDARDFLNEAEPVENKISTSALKDTSTFIFNLLLSIGMVIAIAIGMVLGIQFMVASAEDKAKIKEAFVAYCVGCLVLFGAYGIWKLVVTMAEGIVTF